MKKLSITAKITIWYTVLLAIIAMILVAVLLETQAAQEKSLATHEISDIIADVSGEIRYGGNDFIYDNIEFYQRDTLISVYDGEGRFITGKQPSDISEYPPLNDGKTYRLEDTNGVEWFIYARLFRTDNDEIWIRGAMKHVTHEKTSRFILRYMLFALPIFIILAAIGGWMIIRSAFRPLRNIIRTTEEIRSDADLSKRIPHGESRDELYELTVSINGMFDRIEDVMTREKKFTSNVSHELRTPVAVIQSQSEYAIENPGYSQKALETINKQSKQMGNLINRLLTISRIDSGTMKMDREDIDFSELLADITEQHEMMTSDEGIEITADIQPDIHVIADEGMLIRVIYNLIANAVKYGAPPVTITLTKEDDMAVCTVSDKGKGIPAEEQDKVWNRFYQVDQSRDRGDSSDSSAGLGLAIVQSLTKAMGGTVSLVSEEGCGAAFTVKIPLAPDA